MPREIGPPFLALPLCALTVRLSGTHALGADHADFRFERVHSAGRAALIPCRIPLRRTWLP